MTRATIASFATIALACSNTSSSTGGSGDSTESAATQSTAPSTTGDSADGTDGVPQDDAEVIDVMLPVALDCGESVEAYVVVRNTGTSTWTAEAGYALGAVDDGDPLFAAGRVPLPADLAIAPGDTHAFGMALMAPEVAGDVVTDWQMVHEQVQWFGEVASEDVTVTCSTGVRGGPVRLEGRSFADDGGPFVALGATVMWAAWAYRNDRPRLEANLAYLADHGFHYIRALGVVGDPAAEDFWDGREIEFAWPDYAEVTAGLTALAWDEYGLRVEWTLIGDGQVAVPASRQRDALVDGFVALGDARPEAIMHFEIANEYWQNGFGGPEGLAELRARTQSMRERTDVLVAASSGISDSCAELLAVYDGDVADIATVHTDRDLGTAAGPWGPVLRPVAVNDCAGIPVPTNNEPIGPGASVAVEEDPERLVSAALASYLAGWPAYVFHCDAGVRGLEDLIGVVGSDRYAAILPTLPGDLASWNRRTADDSDAAFAADAAGLVGLLQSDRDDQVVALAVGIPGSATLSARVALSLEVVDILTGAVVMAAELGAGESFVLDGAGARLLRATVHR